MTDPGSDLLNKILGLTDGSSARKTSLNTKKAVDAVGKYLQTTKSSLMGSKSGEDDLVEIEGMVNNWYTQALDSNLGEAVQDNFEKAANGLGQIVNKIENERGGSRDHAHFAKIREVGKHLRNVADLLDDVDV